MLRSGSNSAPVRHVSGRNSVSAREYRTKLPYRLRLKEAAAAIPHPRGNPAPVPYFPSKHGAFFTGGLPPVWHSPPFIPSPPAPSSPAHHNSVPRLPATPRTGIIPKTGDSHSTLLRMDPVFALFRSPPASPVKIRKRNSPFGVDKTEEIG